MFSQKFQYRQGNRSRKQSNEFQSRHCDLCVLLWVAFLLQVAREFPGHCIDLLHEVLEFSQMLLLRCAGCQNGEHCTETVTYCNHHYPHPSPMGLTLTLLLINNNNNHPMTWLCTPSTPVRKSVPHWLETAPQVHFPKWISSTNGVTLLVTRCAENSHANGSLLDCLYMNIFMWTTGQPPLFNKFSCKPRI